MPLNAHFCKYFIRYPNRPVANKQQFSFRTLCFDRWPSPEEHILPLLMSQSARAHCEWYRALKPEASTGSGSILLASGAKVSPVDPISHHDELAANPASTTDRSLTNANADNF